MTPLARIRAVALDAAEAGGRVAMTYFRAPLAVDAKADDSPVTIADRETEAVIRDRIGTVFPTHAFWGEEYGIVGQLDGPAWIIDPIDGTRSFISGHPLFGTLIGFLDGGVPQMGLVAMPALGETFLGLAGEGATLNGRPIRCRRTTRLDAANLHVNEAERIATADPALFARLCRTGQTRRMGHDCYPHALVAAGLIDLVVDYGLQPYDFLPLVALVEAAGGVIADWQGNPLTTESDGRIVTAATPDLLEDMLRVLAG